MGRVRSIVDRVNEVKQWIQKLSEAHDKLGGFSICPYAGTAKYSITQCTLRTITEHVDVDYEYVQVFIVEDECTLEDMMDSRNTLNRRYKDLVFLDDHCSESTYIQGIQSNFGKFNIMLCQQRSELLQARNTLHKTEYYSFWSKELYGRIFNG